MRISIEPRARTFERAVFQHPAVRLLADPLQASFHEAHDGLLVEIQIEIKELAVIGVVVKLG